MEKNYPKETEFLVYKFADEQPKSGKTFRVEIWGKNNGAKLGVLRWWGAWRRYTFWPENDRVFDLKCLQDIGNEIQYLMDDRKKPKPVQLKLIT